MCGGTKKKMKLKFYHMQKIKQKSEKKVYLADLQYKYSMNKYYEFYGENVPYAHIEQESYVDLKSMVFENVNPNIKFRKKCREGKILTLKIEMNDSDLEKITKINEVNGFKFIHDFKISNIRIYNEEEEEALKNGK